jgi:hypothetical protein
MHRIHNELWDESCTTPFPCHFAERPSPWSQTHVICLMRLHRLDMHSSTPAASLHRSDEPTSSESRDTRLESKPSWQDVPINETASSHPRPVAASQATRSGTVVDIPEGGFSAPISDGTSLALGLPPDKPQNACPRAIPSSPVSSPSCTVARERGQTMDGDGRGGKPIAGIPCPTTGHGPGREGPASIGPSRQGTASRPAHQASSKTSPKRRVVRTGPGGGTPRACMTASHACHSGDTWHAPHDKICAFRRYSHIDKWHGASMTLKRMSGGGSHED